MLNNLSFQGVRSYTYLSKRLNPNKKAKVDIKDKMDNIPLKEIDWKIIKELKKNSKTPVLEIAHKLKTSVNTIIRKIKFMKDKEIIERFYPILDVKKLGYTEYTYISRIDPSYEKEIEKFIQMTKTDPRFTIVIKAVGYVNLYYAFLSKDYEELDEITHKVESLFKRGILETHKIEVDNMIS